MEKRAVFRRGAGRARARRARPYQPACNFRCPPRRAAPKATDVRGVRRGTIPASSRREPSMSDLARQPIDETPDPAVAAERAIEAAHNLMMDRLELVRLELQGAITGILRTALATAILAFATWITLVAAVVVVLTTWLPLAGAIAAAAGLQAVLGLGALALVGRD